MNEEIQKPMVVRSHDTHLDSDYVQWIHDVKQRFRNAQIKATVKVNSEQLLFNWQMGRDLVIRKVENTWGTGIVEQVSLDLQNEFPETKGFSVRNLWNMKKWYSFYALAPETEMLVQTCRFLLFSVLCRGDTMLKSSVEANLWRRRCSISAGR